MLHKARLLFALSGTLFLAACMDGPTEDESLGATLTDTTEVQADSDTEEVEKSEATSEVEDVENNNGSNEETEDSESLENTEDASSIEQLDSDFQTAIDKIVAMTSIDIEDSSFSVEESEEYMEISVYEKTEEQSHSPLQGKYRYIFSSEEILAQDYLTGAFIPYGELEEE